MNNEKLKVAVIGLGKMGILHASILNTLNGVELIALCDKSALIQRLFRKLFTKVDVVDDIEKLGALDLDAVYVTTPISSHFPIVKSLYSKAIAHNLFVEKTLASNNTQAEELCELAEKYGGVNMVGYMKRYAVTFRKAKSLLDQGALGELASFNGYAYSSDFFGIGKGSKLSSSRGGVLSDLGSHVVDLGVWFFGNLKVASAKLESLTEENSEDSASFEVEADNNVDGTFEVSWCKENYRMPEFGFSIRGSTGTMNVNDYEVELGLNGGKSHRWFRQDLNDNVGFLLGDPEYFREDEHFVKSIIEGRSSESSFVTASKADHIIDQVKHRADKK